MSNDDIEIEALDQPSFTQIGHWVAFRSDLSPTARHLYTVLAAFVNQGRRANGDTDVWPSLNLLAVTLGLSKGKSVTPYLDELIQARIVEKTTNTIGGMRSRNTYGIRFNPPPGESSTTSFAELLAPLKVIAGDAKAMTKAATETRDLIKERRALESSNRTGRPVVPDSGPRSPESGGTYSRKADRNKTEGELDGGSNVDGGSSSSAAAGEPPAPAAEAPAAKKTKPSPEDIVQERTDATQDEARAVADYVAQQGDAHGNRIRSLAWWLTNREDRALLGDLAHVRRYAIKPGVDVCGLHGVPMAGDCSSCMGDIRAGDTDAVRAHLTEVGGDARPDLVAVLGAPEPPAGARYEDDPGAYWRKTNKAHRGGTRTPVPSREEYDEMANLSQDQLRDVLMGEAPPARAPQAPVSRRQRESDDLFDRAMERARQREAAMANEGTTP